jgi:hypothetical protein
MRSHQGSISPTCKRAGFICKDPTPQRDSQVISSFLRFWDLLAKKLLVNVGEIDTRKMLIALFGRYATFRISDLDKLKIAGMIWF